MAKFPDVIVVECRYCHAEIELPCTLEAPPSKAAHEVLLSVDGDALAKHVEEKHPQRVVAGS